MEAQLSFLIPGLAALLFLIMLVDVGRRTPKRPTADETQAPAARQAPTVEPTEKAATGPATGAVVAERPQSPAPVKEAAAPALKDVPEKSWLERMRGGLSKSRANLGGSLSALFGGGRQIDQDLLEEIETLLLTADVGLNVTTQVIDSVTEKLERKQLSNGDEVKEALRQELLSVIAPCEAPLIIEPKGPYVILVVGVNGVGKTTTIGKMAKQFQAQGHSVMLAAGDTFRAAAVEQLQVWGERNQVPVIAQHTGADSASVIFDAVQAAKSRGVDVVIADTAGRLQNKENLMSELSKVVRVIKKHDDSAPHEVLLVVDGGTGQNALSQAQLFREAVGVTGIALTKLDGTAKGGIVFALAKQHPLPIRFIGVGEGIDDLQPFEARAFTGALFD